MPFKLRYSGIESCGVKIKYMDVCEPKLYKKNFFLIGTVLMYNFM